jgi:hypothetical protein
MLPRLNRDTKISFDDGDTISIFFGPRVYPEEFPIAIHINCDGIDDPVFCLAQVLSQTSSMLLTVTHLEIKAERLWRLEVDYEEVESIDWLDLLRPFTAANRLHVSKEFAFWVALSLEEMSVETASQVLPALDSLFLEGERMQSIEKLFATLRNRGCPDRPLTILGYDAPLSKLESVRMVTRVGNRQISLVLSNTTL